MHTYLYTHTHLKSTTYFKKITGTNLYLLLCKDLRSTKSKPSKSQLKALSCVISPDYSGVLHKPRACKMHKSKHMHSSSARGWVMTSNTGLCIKETNNKVPPKVIKLFPTLFFGNRRKSSIRRLKNVTVSKKEWRGKAT